jgi:hypothetical protein
MLLMACGVWGGEGSGRLFDRIFGLDRAASHLAIVGPIFFASVFSLPSLKRGVTFRVKLRVEKITFANIGGRDFWMTFFDALAAPVAAARLARRFDVSDGEKTHRVVWGVGFPRVGCAAPFEI